MLGTIAINPRGLVAPRLFAFHVAGGLIHLSAGHRSGDGHPSLRDRAPDGM